MVQRWPRRQPPRSWRWRPGLLASLWLMGPGFGGCHHLEALRFQPLFSPAAGYDPLAYPPFLVDRSLAEDYRQQALVYRQRGDLHGAIATLKLAVALDPYALSSYVILGWTQHLAGHASAAMLTLQRALKRDPNHVPALNALGIVYLTSGDPQAAVAIHRRALDQGADNEVAHYNLSLAYQRLREYDLAVTHGQQATRLEPDNPHPWVALALAYEGQGNRAQAITAYRQAIGQDTRYRQASHLSHLAQAGFSTAQIQTVKAIQATSISELK